LPYCLLILEKEIIQFQANRIRSGCVTGRGSSRIEQGLKTDKHGVVTAKDSKYATGAS
jgi:hypothetical protein